MLSYGQQETAYLRLINILNEYSFENDVEAKIEQWDQRTGVAGFPIKYSLNIKYKNIPKSEIDLIFYLDEAGEWSKVEILKMDIEDSFQRKGLGRRLINYTIELAKKIRAKKIFGDILEKPGYSSAGFYEKCGFKIRESSRSRIFNLNYS